MHHGNFIEHYATHHCHHQVDKNAVSRHIATEHLDNVFTHHVKPTFPAYSHALQTRQQVHQRRRLDNGADNDMLEQKWKDTSEGFDTVHVIEWMVDTCSVSSWTSVKKSTDAYAPLLSIFMNKRPTNWKCSYRGLSHLYYVCWMILT